MLLSLAGPVHAATPFTITSPTAGNVWYPGSNVSVTWTGGSPSMLVNLSLVDVQAWAVVATIASPMPNSGVSNWTVPVTVTPGTYLVYIEDVDRTTWTYGENFTISKESARSGDLAISKKPEGPLVAGQNGAYILGVSNVGTGPIFGTITVTDTLGAGLTPVAVSGAGWTCSIAGSTVTCTYPGPLPPASSLPPIVITVAVAKDAQKVENCARVTAEKDQDLNLANNSTCIGSVTVPPTTGSICGFKFDDKNGNGIQDAGEGGLAGWTILLTDAAGNLVASVLTGANGEYCFKGLALGTYTVAEVNQPGWTQTAPASGTYSATLTNQQPHVSPFTFGNHYSPRPGVICGFKFLDLNGNGVQETGEPGLPGWTIQMLNASANVVATVTSGQGGKFCFDGVKPGTYTFVEVMKPNWMQTAPATPGYYVVTVQPGLNPQQLIFGNRPRREPCCLTFRFPAGKVDNFSTANGLEPASPSPALVASLPPNLLAVFDSTKMDHFFAHTFTLPQGNCIRSARLEIRARPLGYGSTVANDGLWLRFTGVAGSPSWSSYIGGGQPNPGLLPLPWQLPNYGAGALITLDLANLPGPVNLLPWLQSQRFLDLVMQDDTSVDAMRLTVEFCECGSQAAPGQTAQTGQADQSAMDVQPAAADAQWAQ